MSEVLEAMWELHRDYVRRVLIGLTRDIDLADDLAQETYLRAANGIGGFRGGDARAWLSTIARNVFNQHIRRKYSRSEASFTELADDFGEHAAPATDNLLQIDLQQALAELNPALRSALVMRHYGGFTYNEIAERLGCPVGTAKWRVSVALSKLRLSLGVPKRETAAMKCRELTGARILDYIGGTLPTNEHNAIRAHLAACPACKEKIDDTANVLKALDSIDANYKATTIVDIDQQGYSTGYLWMSMPNTTDDPMETMTIQMDGVEYMTIQGEEVKLELLPDQPAKEGMRSYFARLPQPVALGERIHMHVVVRHAPGPGAVVRLEDNLWRFGPGKLILTEEMIYVAAIRLPEDAELVKAKPEADEVRSGDRTTIIWRGTLPPDQQFEFAGEYRLARAAEA